MQPCCQQASVSLQGTSWEGRACKLGWVRKQSGGGRCLVWDCKPCSWSQGPEYRTQQRLHYVQVLPWMWREHCDLTISPRWCTLFLQELCRYRLRLSDMPGRNGHCGCLCLWWKPEMKTAVLVAKNRGMKKEERGKSKENARMSLNHGNDFLNKLHFTAGFAGH